MPRLPDKTALGDPGAYPRRPMADAGDLRTGARLPGSIANTANLAPYSLADTTVQIPLSVANTGADQIARGVESLAGSIKEFALQRQREEDYETKKRLIEFKLQTEMDLENHKRTIEPGGHGFSDAWGQAYGNRARQFLGPDGANVPRHLRRQVDYAVAEHGIALSERAQRFQFMEHDKYELEGLNQTLDLTKGKVEVDPSRRDEMLKEGESLVDLSRLSPADKYRTRRNFRRDIDKTAGLSMLMRAETAEDYDKLKKIYFQPDAPDRSERIGISERALQDASTSRELPQFSGKPSAGYWGNDAAWQRLTGIEKAAAIALLEADVRDGKVDLDAATNVLGAMINRADKEGKPLGDHVSSKAYQPTIEPAQYARLKVIVGSPAFRELVDLGRARLSGEAEDWVKGATHFLAPEGRMLALERGEPEKYKDWGPRGSNWTGFGKDPSRPGEYSAVVFRDGSHAFLAPAGAHSARLRAADDAELPPEPGTYAGPLTGLSLPERRALWNQAETKRKQAIAVIEKEIASWEKIAQDGYQLPPEMLADLSRRVRNSGDKTVEAHFLSTLGLADLTRELNRLPPVELERMVGTERSRILKEGITPAQEKRLDHLEKTLRSMKEGVNNDQLSWANRVGIVKLDPIDFSKDESLARRAEQGREVAQYYNQEPTFFTKNERDALVDKMRVGGEPMLGMLSKINKAFGADASAAIREIAKDAPEAAWISGMIANGANPQAIKDAAQAIELRRDKNFKKSLPENEDYRSAMTAELGTTFQALPHSKAALVATANAIYEVRALRKGNVTTFDSDLWRESVKEAIGERDVKGEKYGGLHYQSRGIFGLGKGSPVVVPPNMKQKEFRTAIDTIRHEDLIGAFGEAPVTGSGNPLSMGALRQATLVSVGNGQYWMAMGDPQGADPMWVKSHSGDNYTLDLNRLEPVLRKRRPDLYEPAASAPLRFTSSQAEHMAETFRGIDGMIESYEPGKRESDNVEDRRSQGRPHPTGGLESDQQYAARQRDAQPLTRSLRRKDAP